MRTRKWKYIAYRPTREQLSAMKNGEVDRAYNLSGRLHSETIMRNYPHYFAPDQLYDLENDPDEQINLATDPTYAGVLAEMQARLERYLDSFARPFDLSVDEFLTSDVYSELIGATLQDDRIYKTYWYLQQAY